jgi:hypothetical protein
LHNEWAEESASRHTKKSVEVALDCITAAFSVNMMFTLHKFVPVVSTYTTVPRAETNTALNRAPWWGADRWVRT